MLGQVFFFQAEDGIRVGHVTGVQTCALPILSAGDEVIVPSFTFAATANSVAVCGGVPVFVDVDPETFAVDPAAVRAAITERTVGIQPVHLYGHPEPMDQIMAIDRVQEREMFDVRSGEW